MNFDNTHITILIVDDIPENVSILFDYLSRHGFRTLVAEDGPSALEVVSHLQPDLILLDVMMPEMDGYETCRRLKQQELSKDIPVIFMTALSDIEDKIKGFQAGAVDYITKPFQQEEVLARVNTHLTISTLRKELIKTNEKLEDQVKERTKELKQANESLSKSLDEVSSLKEKLQQENIYLKEEIKLSHNFDEIITNSTAFKNILRQIEQVAPTNSTVLVLGETGTGKELIARAVHNFSSRRDMPLVKVNCASLPANLIESELFGHEKGAFTGALAKKIGRFELADRGSIFLDEIGDLPPELQSKLLRVLQEGEFERLGNSNTFKTDVRVIAATNHDLQESIRKGNFREDLYYRLNVFPVLLPPLRDRPGDVPLLVWHFINKYTKRMGKDIKEIPESSLKDLENYAWPGNVRELENVIERAVILSRTNVLEIDDAFLKKTLGENGQPGKANTNIKTLKDVERQHIVNELDACNWIIEGKRGAAIRLGIAPSTLRDRMRRLSIKRPEY